jgi:hypothetical protein
MTTPAARGPLNPVGSAPDALVAEAIAEDTEPLMLDATLETALCINEALEDVALSRLLDTLSVMEATTEEIELTIEMDADMDGSDMDGADEDSDVDASDGSELTELATLSTPN